MKDEKKTKEGEQKKEGAEPKRSKKEKKKKGKTKESPIQPAPSDAAKGTTTVEVKPAHQRLESAPVEKFVPDASSSSSYDSESDSD